MYSVLKIRQVTFYFIIAVLAQGNSAAASTDHYSEVTGSTTLDIPAGPVMVAERKRVLGSRFRSSTSTDFKVDRSDVDEEDYARSVVDKLYDEISNSGDTERVLDTLDDATKGQRAIYLATVLREQVNEGGFDMYLSTDAGNLIVETRDSLRVIDAVEYVKILDKVLALFVSEQDEVADKSVRRRVLDKIPAARKESLLDRLDSDFYTLERLDSLSISMKYYIKKHPRQFFSK